MGWWPSAIPRRLAVHMESGGARRWRMSQARPSWTRPCPHGWSWTRRATGPSSSQTDRLARWSPRPRFLLFAPSLTVLLRSLRWCLPLSKIHAFASRGASGEPAGAARLSDSACCCFFPAKRVAPWGEAAWRNGRRYTTPRTRRRSGEPRRAVEAASRRRPGVDGRRNLDRGWTVYEIPSSPWVPVSRRIRHVRSIRHVTGNDSVFVV